MRPWIAILALVGAAVAQTTVAEGDVTDRVTGAPLAGAYVSKSAGPNLDISVTDASGHFRLSASDRYFSGIQVERAGYLPFTQSVRLGQSIPAFQIKLTPQAVVTGKVEDEDGFPVRDADVQVFRYRLVNGERKLTAASSPGGKTNDLGEYRIAGLPAGRYYVRASPGNLHGNWDARYHAQYYPAAIQPGDATRVEVKAGQERGGVDFRLTRLEGVTVEGRAIGLPYDGPSRRLSIVLWAEDMLGGSDFAMVRPGGDSFTIRHVAPGTYTIRVLPNAPQPKPGDLSASRRIEVGDSDVRDLVLTLHPIEAFDWPGTLVAEGDVKQRPTSVILRAMDGSGVVAPVNEDGSFLVKGILPGSYSQIIVSSGGAATIRWGDRTLSPYGPLTLDEKPAAPLKITVRAYSAIAKGTLLDAAGHPVPGAVLAVYSTTDGMRSAAQTDPEGAFTLAAPPGDYSLYAATDSSQAVDLDDPEFLDLHRKDFAPIHMVAGQNPPLTLRMPVTQ
jgi:hypothetical protein